MSIIIDGTAGITATGSLTGLTTPLAINQGGTNSTATPTAGGVIFGNGTAHAVTAAGSSGQYLQSAGTGTPVWASIALSGTLINIQYFTSTGTYTPTAGTGSVIVEVVGGGGGGRSYFTGGAAGAGGTTSFGALVSATGGGAGTTAASGGAGGSGSGGDINITGGNGCLNSAASASSVSVWGGNPAFYASMGCGIVANSTRAVSNGYGYGGACSTAGQSGGSGGGGGYARKKITSSFSGVTITIGAAGSSPDGAVGTGGAGLCVVYEYA